MREIYTKIDQVKNKINDIKDDYIGVDYYIKSLKEAIKQDATVISINSEYGIRRICGILFQSLY